MSNFQQQISENAGTSRFLGVALLVLGFLSLLSPMIPGLAVAFLVGILLLAGGALRTLYAFRAPSFGNGMLAFLFGVISIAGALVMLFHPLLGLAVVTIFLAIYFFVEGICEILLALQIKPINGWAAILVSGVLSLLLSFMIWSQWPVSGLWAIGVLVGVKLLMGGAEILAIGSIPKQMAARV